MRGKGRLTRSEKDGLLNFLGYGNPKSPIWFLGMEEKLPVKFTAVLKEFKIRAKFEPIMDLYDAHCLLGRCVEKMEKISQVWLWMAKLVRGLNELSTDWKSHGKAVTYVKRERQFGSKDGKTFLVELSPVPSASRSECGWTDDHRRNFGERKQFESRSNQRRRKIVKKLLQKYKPKYLFAYGKENWQEYYKIIGLKESELATISETRNRIRIGHWRGITIVLLPFPGNGCFGERDAKRLLAKIK